VAHHGVVEELAALTRRAGLTLAPGPAPPRLAQPRQRVIWSLAFQIAVVRLADQGPGLRPLCRARGYCLRRWWPEGSGGIRCIVQLLELAA
jgi:hypothetical protein